MAETSPWNERPVVDALDQLAQQSASYPPDAEALMSGAAEDCERADRPSGAEVEEYDRRVDGFVREQLAMVRQAAWASITSDSIPPSCTVVALHPAASGLIDRVMRETARVTGARGVRVVEAVDGTTEVRLSLHLIWDEERYSLGEATDALQRVAHEVHSSVPWARASGSEDAAGGERSEDDEEDATTMLMRALRAHAPDGRP